MLHIPKVKNNSVILTNDCVSSLNTALVCKHTYYSHSSEDLTYYPMMSNGNSYAVEPVWTTTNTSERQLAINRINEWRLSWDFTSENIN